MVQSGQPADGLLEYRSPTCDTSHDTSVEGENVTSDQPNPYAAPATDSTAASHGNVDPASLKKIEAIIKDAGQFWLAIIICIVCSGVGSIIIGPWYLVRLIQWNSMAQAQPRLLERNVPRGSLAQRFQSAKIKLIIGMSFGAVILLLVILSVILLFVISVNSARGI